MRFFPLLLLFSVACRTPAEAPPPPVPLALSTSAYEAAIRTVLPEQPALDHEDLHNVFFLSENIISGGEPHSEEALERLAGWGVRTILSVDGKAPMVDAARRHGMRYVHVPIQYAGITEEQTLRIAKTFRELEGPFFVHCFHGQHRGPAGAEIGRLVLDGIPREQAIAEMRQWLGTSPSYEGLYQTIACQPLPDAAASSGLAWDFTPAVESKGLRGAMIFAARTQDNLKALKKVAWKTDPSHPDLVGTQEAGRLAEAFKNGSDDPVVLGWEPEYRALYASIVADSLALEQALTDLAKGRAEAQAEADALVDSLGRTCKSCHKDKRD